MPSTSRIGSTVRHTIPQSSYVCLRCRLQASTVLRTTSPSIPLPYIFRRHASWINTDKLRKRIWKENPPGQIDPYAKESDFERETRERREEEKYRKELESVPEEENKPVREGEAAEPNYVPATTIDGLKWVGGHRWGKSEWKAENPYEGFMGYERSEGRKDVVLAVHRALVETYALKEAGLPLAMDYYSTDPTKDYARRVAEGAKFGQDANGQTALMLEDEKLREDILKCVTPQKLNEGATEETQLDEENMESEGAAETPSEAVEEDEDTNLGIESSEQQRVDEERLDTARSSDLAPSAPASDTWRDVSLEDAAIKFAVLKRVMQLTGKRIPDPDISAITTPGSLIVHIVKKPKPQRVAEVLQKSNPVVQLPNVQIRDKRYGPIDREIEVGRWKVIKKELKKRGLPVLTRRAVVRDSLREGRQ